MAVLLAAGAAMLFGALAVAIRIAFRSGADADAGALVTTAVAWIVCVVVAALFGQWSRVPWADTWPFLTAGTVAPGISQLLFTRAVELIGASRTAILVGITPVLSAAIAIALLDEPFRVSLAIGTILVVGGGTMLAWDRGGARGLFTLGTTFGSVAAALFSFRDNFVRWAERGSAVPGVVAAACSLAAATVVLAVFVAVARDGAQRTRAAARPFLVSGAIYGLAYAFLLTAFDRGRVTVVAPLYATESLWAVLFAAVVLRRAEAIGLRVLAAAVLVVAGGALIGGFR
ncbi:MAG TPA: DMT family transporter [Gaiellaceae bacterium]|nr:DMT family transporter [Gaiellaceae bacterium]